MNNLGDIIKFKRQELGYSQQQLADILSVSRVTVTRYENNSRIPEPENLKKLATIFNISIDYLLGHTDDPTPYRNVDADLDAERDLDKELLELLKEEEMAAFYDFANMDAQTKKEIIEFIRFKKGQEK